MQTNGHTRPTAGEPRGEPPTDQVRLTVAQAAVSLGITEGAVRSRIKRGTLPTVKEGGTVYVVWSSGTPTTNQPPHNGEPPGEPSDQPQANELVEALQEQVEYLRGQLDQEREAGRRKDHLLAAALERIPAIEPPETTPPESPPETPGAPETARESGDSGHDVPPDASSAAEGGSEYRSWWRRLFSG